MPWFKSLFKKIYTESLKAPARQYKYLTEGKLKNKDTVSYVFKASSNYYILLNTKKDSKEFEFKIEIRDDTVKLSSLIDDLTYVYKEMYNSIPERIVNHIKNNIETQKKILGEYIVKDQNISFLFNYYDPFNANDPFGLKLTDNSKLTDIHKSKLTINNDNSIQIFINYVNLLIVSYDDFYATASGRLKKKGSNYSGKEDFRDDIRDVIIWSQGPYDKKGGKKNNSKKSKDEKMSGGENGEISKTFKRKSPGMGITPYDLTISTEPNSIINLEIKITSNNLLFKTFKEGFSLPLKPKTNTNAQTIYDIKNLFDQKIKKTTRLGKEFVVNGQTILFKFNLDSKKSTVTIGDKSISINITFMNVLFSIYSNNKLSLLNKPSNGKPFKNVVINIRDKIGKEQTNKTTNQTNQQNNKPIKQPYQVPYNIR